MGIATYSDLVTAVDQWLTAGTLSTSRIDECIALAEARMSRDLFVPVLEKRAYRNTVADDEYVEFPSDLRRVRSVKLNTDPRRRLEYITPDAADANYTSQTGGKPVCYSVVGTEFRLVPIPDAAYELEIIYSIGVPALTSSATSNDVLTRYPDLYLRGVLFEAHLFLMDDANAQKWGALYQQSIAEINRTEAEARYGGSALSMRAV